MGCLPGPLNIFIDWPGPQRRAHRRPRAVLSTACDTHSASASASSRCFLSVPPSCLDSLSRFLLFFSDFPMFICPAIREAGHRLPSGCLGINEGMQCRDGRSDASAGIMLRAACARSPAARRPAWAPGLPCTRTQLPMGCQTGEFLRLTTLNFVHIPAIPDEKKPSHAAQMPCPQLQPTSSPLACRPQPSDPCQKWVGGKGWQNSQAANERFELRRQTGLAQMDSHPSANLVQIQKLAEMGYRGGEVQVCRQE